MAEESSSRLTISLARYDGPFDVLISLIRRNEWSIDDLPVLEITRQFLAHIKAAEDMDAELGGEFVETASWLVLLKSRSMLPGEANEPLPKEELRRAVLDHATLRAATDLLRGGYDRNAHPGRDRLPSGRAQGFDPAGLARRCAHRCRCPRRELVKRLRLREPRRRSASRICKAPRSSSNSTRFGRSWRRSPSARSSTRPNGSRISPAMVRAQRCCWRCWS